MRAIALVVALCVAQTVSAAPARRGPRLGLVIGGTVMFAAGYLTAVGLGARYTQGELGVPIFGPLIDLRRCDRCTGPAAENAVVAGLVIDFALQAAGLAMVIAGVVPAHHRHDKSVSWSLAPAPNGLWAVGRF